MFTPVSRRRLNLDYTLIALVLGLLAIGFFALHSASHRDTPWHLVQLGWLVFGVTLSAVVATVDYRIYERYAYAFYGVIVALLMLVLVLDNERNNAKRWLDLGLFDAQPSEPMKLAIVLVTARILHERSSPGGHRLRDLALPLVLVLIPCVLVAAEPDLGTAMVIGAIFITVVLFDGIRKSSLIMLIVGALIVTPLVWEFGLRGYQRDRVTAFLDSEGLHNDEAYQVQQAIIAVGSGGLFGKGQGMGTQVQSGRVPENENDFIFAHIGEEHGFVGSALLLLLYSGLVLWALRIARYARDKFGVLVAVGVAAIFFWHVVINVGMVVGVLPVVGLWLPFISYGGSATLTMMSCVGLLMNLSVRRHVFQRMV